jgi:amino acid adenylation domain-containing protein/FkbM family methyltransferase
MSKKENNIEKIYLLTPMQEGMLFHTLNDKSHAYFTQLCYSTRGKLDLDVFSKSLDLLSKRHDVLRTAFVYGKTEKPIQVVLKNRKIDLTVKDVTDLNETEFREFLKDYRNADIEKGFNLISEPLIRLTICKRGENLHNFIWSYHHILLDGWCHTILIEELSHIYQALYKGVAISLPEPVTFDRFVNWLGKKDLSVSEKYWEEYLKGYDHVARLPKIISDHKIAPKGLKKQLRFSKERTRALTDVGKSKNVTVNDIFQTIWALILAKYTNSNDVVYGNVVSGRPADIDGMDRCLGLFINTIPVRLTIEDSNTFLELVTKIHEDSLDSLPHHYNSLAEVQNKSALKSELIQHVIAFENYPLSTVDEKKEQEGFLEIFNIDAFDQTNYEFDIDVELGEEIEVTFFYNPSSYNTKFVERLSDSFNHLATQFINNPEIKVTDLEFVNEANTNELLFEFNGSAIDLENTDPINVRFEEYASKYPEETAVIHESTHFTYDKLNSKANQLANLLLDSGIGKGDFIGVFGDRSSDFIAALLAIFKAGGVYVPLDTQNPLGRTIELIKDSQLKALFCEKQELDILKSELQSDHLKNIICFNNSEVLENTVLAGTSISIYGEKAIADSNSQNPANRNDINDWAYMLYTSGSTGKPKGAITRHNGAMNHILAEYKALKLADGFRFLQSASIASDISVWQMLAPLLKGGAVVIANKEDVLEYAHILKMMQEYKITIAEFVPSYLIGFVEYISSLEPASIKMPMLAWMMMVGEEVPVKLVNTWLRLYPECKVLNGYGPCEASDDITQFEMSKPLPSHTVKVPIGRPLANMNIFVLDEHEKLVPVGVSGEICVSGVGVGAGYFKEPEKTAASFKRNQFKGTLGDTMYKTGDLGRWLPDGNLEFMGRIDRQVKIRGNRVELGEIESFIRKTKLVSNVHLAAYKNEGEKSLIAFLEVPKISLTPVLNEDFVTSSNDRINELQQENPSLKGKVMTLDENLKAFSLNNPETAFAYKEIFLDNAYLQRGIELKPGAVVFDVGANVGVFSMMVSTCFPGSTIYAFEPIPPIFEIMKANTDLYGGQATVFAYNAGLSDSNKKVTFTHYPKNSMLSGRYGDEYADKGYVRNVMKHQLGSHGEQAKGEESSLIENHIEMMTEDSMHSEDYECQLLSFSEIVEKHQIEKVDLLKIDVERSELDVITGIEDKHWGIIKQIVIEVHQDGASLDYVKQLLAAKGFICFTKQEDALVGTNLYNIYAVRNEPESYQQIRSAITKKCLQGLPGYMQPSEYCFVEKIPTNLSDKADEKQLLSIFNEQKVQEANVGKTKQEESKLTPTEAKLKQVWEKVLNKTNISIQDDFFEIGGHSLLAMRAKASIFKDLGVNIEIRNIFEYSQLSQQADFLDRIANTKPVKEIRKLERPERIPLSYSQQSIWFLDQLQGSTEYHIPAILNLKGSLDITILNDCLKAIVDRHEVLKMVVNDDKGQACQEIITGREWEIEIITDTSVNKQENQLSLISELIEQPFNLSKDFKLRATLIQNSVNSYILVLVMHHIASDGWSESILVDELMQLYAAKSAGKNAKLPEFSFQYADYAVWQQHNKDAINKDLDYWENTLQDIAPIKLPTDFERPKVQSNKGDSVEQVLNTSKVTEIKRLAKGQDVTVFMFLIGAFRILMHRYTGQNNICIGIPVAGRSHQEFENLIGFFVNSLALNMPIDDRLPFSDFLKQVKNTTLDAFEHQEAPFEKVVEVLQEQRDLSRNPLFQVMFTVQNTPETKPLELGNLEISMMPPKEILVNVDLNFIVEEQNNGSLLMEIEYCSELFKKATIARMLQNYLTLLDELIIQPDLQIGYLSMQSENESVLIQNFHNKRDDIRFNSGDTVLEIWKERVYKSPDNIAVIDENNQYSYKELDERSNQIARFLLEKGVSAESFVPVCFNRSVQLFETMLGIFKSGSVYVPISPDYPIERINFILEDLKADLLITDTDVTNAVSALPQEQIYHFDRIDNEFSKLSKEPVNTDVTSGQLAYILYTSGTTGQPKGVMIEHKSLYGFLIETDALFPVNEGDRIAFKSNYCFDVTICELMGCIIQGGSMVVFPQGIEKDIKALLKFVIDFKVTHLHLVPSLFSVAMQHLDDGIIQAFNCLKYIIAGGEVLPPNQVEEFQALCVNSSLINIYGPTEATVFCTYYDTSDFNKSLKSTPIGKAISNVELTIVNEYLREVPVGVVGELCLSGQGVARGYYNREELTAEKFVSHPHNAEKILYKTGDLVKWLPDGNIEYVGRKDNQVKINGQRIELGEIESVFNTIKGIQQSVIILKQDKSGNQKLVAYYITKTSITEEYLREQLSSKLPAYMHPGFYIELDSFPVNSNGKVETRRLPDPGMEVSVKIDYKAPSSVTEKRLLELWQEMLGLENISITDNFFELGGHSILAMRLVYRIQDIFGVTISLVNLFEYPQIESLARALEEIKMRNDFDEIPELEPNNSYECSAGQTNIWLASQVTTDSSPFNIITAFKVNTDFRKNYFAKALDVLVERHEILRTNFIDQEGIPMQKIHRSEPAFYHIDFVNVSQAVVSVKDVFKEESNHNFDLANERLIRIIVISDTSETYIVFNIHHIIADGWSLEVFRKELGVIYEALLRNDEFIIPSLSIQYKEFAAWHNKMLLDEEGEAARFWKERLKHINNREDLQLDRERTAVRSSDSAIVEFSLGSSVSEKLKEIASRLHTGIFTVIQSMVKVYLLNYLQSENVVIGTPVAGRNHPQLENQIGFYVNVLALPTTLSVSESFEELVQRVHKETQEAYKYQNYPHHKLVSLLNLPRELHRNPLFDVSVAYNEGIESLSEEKDQLFSEYHEELSDNHNKHDLTYGFETGDDKLTMFSITYSTSLFYKSSIEKMGDEMTLLFEKLLNDPANNLGTFLQTQPGVVHITDDFS